MASNLSFPQPFAQVYQPLFASWDEHGRPGQPQAPMPPAAPRPKPPKNFGSVVFTPAQVALLQQLRPYG